MNEPQKNGQETDQILQHLTKIYNAILGVGIVVVICTIAMFFIQFRGNEALYTALLLLTKIAGK